MSASRTQQEAKAHERKKEFKKGIDPTESRRRREEEALSIRKNKVNQIYIMALSISNRSPLARGNDLKEASNDRSTFSG